MTGQAMKQAVRHPPTQRSAPYLRIKGWDRFGGLLRKVWPSLALITVLAGLFQSLLLRPELFPVSGTEAQSARGILDVVQQSDVYRSTGDIVYLDPEGRGRNLAVEPPQLMTHPVFFVLQHVLPVGLSLTLLIVLHLFAGATATYCLARRADFSTFASLFASLVFLLSGQLLNGGVEDCSSLGFLMTAALFPANVLHALRVLEKPTVERGTVLGLFLGLATVSGEPSATALTVLLLAPTVLALCWPWKRAMFSARCLWVLLFALLWGGALACYRWLPVVAMPQAAARLLAVVDLPWWKGQSSLKLPYHLGVVTLVTFLLGARNLSRMPCGTALLPLAGLALLVAVLGPQRALPFLGFFLGMTAAAAFLGFPRPYRSWLRESLALFAVIALLFEVAPYHLTNLRGRALVELTDLAGSDNRARGEPRPALSGAPITRVARVPVSRNSQEGGAREVAGRLFALGDDPTPTPSEELEALPVSIWERTPGHLRGEVEVDRPSILVTEEPFMPGMAAWVGKRRTAILRSNGSHLGLVLSKGSHTVEVRFIPPGLELGQTVSSLAAAVLPFVLLIPSLRRRIRSYVLSRNTPRYYPGRQTPRQRAMSGRAMIGKS